ncbi:trigger factor [Rhodovulum sp. DZ06]|uniref:trigger factor n=1 Tax=Rhodovulum sp. DZ06 TaxID=3425126 RepID=UPI003D34DBB0
MQVTETTSDGLKRGYTMTLPADALEAKMTEKLEAARADVQMKGFRKGKAPLPLLRKMFGQSLLGEVLQESVDGAVRAHFEQTGDRPALQPDVKIANEDFKEGQDLVVEVSYEKLPDVPEADFAAIKLTRPVAAVADEDVNEALGNLAENAKTFADKDGAAETGDQVVIDFVGKVDGEAFEGGSAEDYPLELGSNSFIPGFEDQLVGVSTGDEKDVNVTFPAEYGAEHLAGKDAVFSVTVKGVKAPAKAEIDDELAQKFGAENLEDLKKQVTERLEAEYKGAARTLIKRDLLDAIDAAVKFDLPPTLVEMEAKQIAHQLWHDENPDVHGHDHPEIEPTDEHNSLAERRVRLGLLLAEIGQKQEIEVSEQELQQAVFAEARKYPGQERQFFEFIQNNPQALQQFRAPLFEEKVVDYILELVDMTDETITKDELQKRLEALDEDSKAAEGETADA